MFKTDLFFFDQADDDIDHWFIGGDCAGWFYIRLLAVKGIEPYMEPVMEDWGWCFAVSVNSLRVWVYLWPFYDSQDSWLFGFETKSRLFRRASSKARTDAGSVVSDAVHNILRSDNRFIKFEWFEKSPFDTGLREF